MPDRTMARYTEPLKDQGPRKPQILCLSVVNGEMKILGELFL